jgi:hypothetical protein
MTLLHDVLDPAELADAIGNGLVRLQRHPTLPFVIYNYTEACQYSAAWTPVTLACRGLVVDAGGRIAARPMAKFFNHSESHAPVLEPGAKVSVTDKMDGSLGVIYHDGSGWAVATRGSFASDQAQHATGVLRGRYRDSSRRTASPCSWRSSTRGTGSSWTTGASTISCCSGRWRSRPAGPSGPGRCRSGRGRW